MSTETKSPSDTRERLLVVEDDPGVLATVRDILLAEGWDVATAADATAGLQLATVHRPHLIISDIGLPGEDGYGFLSRVREKPGMQSVPVIFLTGRSDHANQRLGMELGADDYLVKPFDPPELIRAVRTRLDRRRAMEEGLQKFRESVACTLPHELRTPLVGVIGFAELLMQESHEAGASGQVPANVVRERVRYIQQSGRRLLDLVERYTLWVELSARAPELAGQRASWGSTTAVTGAVERLRLLAQERARIQDLQVMLPPARLAVPEGYLPLVLAQLLDNSLKFSRPGQPVMVLGVVMGKDYMIHVRDSGRGLPPDSVERIAAFVQFERDKWEQQGVGLGLAIVKQFAALVGGEFRLESRPGGGDTRAVLRVPLALPT